MRILSSRRIDGNIRALGKQILESARQNRDILRIHSREVYASERWEEKSTHGAGPPPARKFRMSPFSSSRMSPFSSSKSEAGWLALHHVSILATPLRITHTPFQSSPALSSGRYERQGVLSYLTTCFNPRPPFRAGATRVRLRFAQYAANVSILARPFERALRAFCYVTHGARCVVSILARPFERALRCRSIPFQGMRGFNPRPPFRAGATSPRPPPKAPDTEFQSSPALSSGRYCTTLPRPENMGFGPGFREHVAIASQSIGNHVRPSIQVIENPVE